MTSRIQSQVATGEEARSALRWVRRVLPPLLLRALVALVVAGFLVLGYGRLSKAVQPENSRVCTTMDCPQPGSNQDPDTDIWDLIF